MLLNPGSGRWFRKAYTSHLPAMSFVPFPGQAAENLLGAQSDVNLAHRYPFRCRADGFDQWFSNSDLSRDKLDLVRNLTVTNGHFLGLVDIDLLQEALTPQEFQGVFRSLFSEPSLLALLSDSRRGRFQVIEILGPQRPRQVRCAAPEVTFQEWRHYKYHPIASRFRTPSALYVCAPSDRTNGPEEDSFWTAMNFFNEKPDPSLLNLQTALARLKTDYLPSPTRKRSAICSSSRIRTIARSMPVFTSLTMWYSLKMERIISSLSFVLMRTSDVLAKYQTEGGLQVTTLRPRK